MFSKQNGGSSTCVVEPFEPIELHDVSGLLKHPQEAKLTPTRGSLHISETRGSKIDEDPVENLPSPITQGAEQLERWNHPRLNFWRTLAAFWSFVVMGSNDAAYGVCLPIYTDLVNVG
jgi:hypothetical protein